MSVSTGASRELEALFVDESEQAVDSLLKTTLGPLLGFTRDGRTVTKAPFLELQLPARVLSVMLARLAMVRLNVPSAKAEATSEQLESECMATVKAVRECLSRLKRKNLLAKNDVGYFIPVWAVAKAVQEVQHS
jgi:hypothetical protein